MILWYEHLNYFTLKKLFSAATKDALMLGY